MKKKYKLLLVIRWPVGGIRTFIRYVYNNFDSQAYNLTIIAPDLPELRILLADLDNFEVSYIPLDRNPSNISFFRIVSKSIITGKFDLVHSHGFTAGIFSILGSVVTHTHHVVTLHEVLNECQFMGIQGCCRKIAMSILLPFIDIIHLVGHDARENLLGNIGILKFFKKKLCVIPNGVQVERYIMNANTRNFRRELILSEDSFLIGFLGRFMPAKGFKHLVDAIDVLYKEYALPKKPIVLAFGAGAYIREEKQNIWNKNLNEYFYFMQFAPDVASILRGLDVVAIPSLWETYPLLPIEAMVSGVPVIGTDCIGLREVLANTPAVVVQAKNSRALANALWEEMYNPSQSKAMLFREEASKRFDVKKQSEELERLILSRIKQAS